MLGAIILLTIVNVVRTKGSMSNLIFPFYAYSLLTPLLLNFDDLRQLLNKANKFLCIIVSLSIILHIFRLVGVLPRGLLFPLGDDLVFQNYIVYVNRIYPFETPRFFGFCIEPGFFGLLMSAMLLVNRFDFRKKSTIIYFVALLLTLSLGGYLITFICWFLFASGARSIKVSRFVIMGALFGLFAYGLFYFATNIWNNGNNVFNEYIVERLVYDESKGTISGNNRQNEAALDMWYVFSHSEDVFWGIGVEEYEKMRGNNYNGSSIYEYIIVSGIFGTLLYVFSIAILAFKRNQIRYSFPGFMLLLLDFLQHGFTFESTMLILLWIHLESISPNTPRVYSSRPKLKKINFSY